VGGLQARKRETWGLRIIYFVFLRDSSIWLMTLYGKDEMDDLSPEERKLLKEAIKEEKADRASGRRTAKRVRR